MIKTYFKMKSIRIRFRISRTSLYEESIFHFALKHHSVHRRPPSFVSLFQNLNRFGKIVVKPIRFLQVVLPDGRD